MFAHGVIHGLVGSTGAVLELIFGALVFHFPDQRVVVFVDFFLDGKALQELLSLLFLRRQLQKLGRKRDRSKLEQKKQNKVIK